MIQVFDITTTAAPSKVTTRSASSARQQNGQLGRLMCCRCRSWRVGNRCSLSFQKVGQSSAFRTPWTLPNAPNGWVQPRIHLRRCWQCSLHDRNWPSSRKGMLNSFVCLAAVYHRWRICCGGQVNSSPVLVVNHKFFHARSHVVRWSALEDLWYLATFQTGPRIEWSFWSFWYFWSFCQETYTAYAIAAQQAYEQQAFMSL